MDTNKVTKARVRLVMSRPFYGTLALRMKVVEDPTCRTAWTDGTRFGYNPAFISKLPLEQVIGIWAHECLHPAFLHHTRRKFRTPFRWNVAADYAINPILTEDDLVLPPQALNDPKYAGMSAEAIYSQLPDEDDLRQQFNHDEDPGGCGEVRDNNNGQSTEMTEHEWKQAVAQAAHAARIAGKLPAGLERFIGDILYTTTPWRDILRQFIYERSNDDFSWMRPNRRHIAQNIYLPSAYSESMGEIVVAIDTSGSIGEKELTLFGSELSSIISDARPSKTYRVFCDAEVARTDEYGPDDEIQWKGIGNIGGGGTDFCPVFEWIEKNDIKPKCLVYLTDMYGSFPKAPPDYPVMWASITKDYEAPFGQVVYVDPES